MDVNNIIMELLKPTLFVISDPLVQVFVVFIIGLFFHSFRKWWVFAVYYFILVSTSIFYVAASTVWSVSDKISQDKEYDVALLLLGVSDYNWHNKYTSNNRNKHCNLNKNGGRVGYIVQQMRSGKINQLVMGGLIIGDFDETACVVDLLLQYGIEESRITVLGDVKRTVDEVAELKRYLSHSDHQSVLMVTSGYHMRRAISIAHSQKINTDYYSVDKVSYDTVFDDFIISAKWLHKTKYLFYELAAYIGYFLTGRL